jgi:tight adherence protein B
MVGPVAQEFRRLGVEVGLGRPLPAALRAVGQRMDSDEMEWVAVAVEIHQQAGGNLAQILDTVAATSTDRQRLQREVATLTAEGRISAVVLGILPPALAVVISVLNPGYLGSLVAEPLGMIMVVASVVGMVVGFVWMHRIVGIEL